MYLIRTACKTSKSYLEVNPFMIHNIPHENKPLIVGGIFDKHVQVWKVRLAPKMKAPVHITDISTSIVLICSHPHGRSSSEWRQCFCKQRKKRINYVKNAHNQSCTVQERSWSIKRDELTNKFERDNGKARASKEFGFNKKERSQSRSSSATTSIYLKHLHRRPPPRS